MTLAKAYGQDINGDWIPLGADEVGNLLVSMGVGFSSDPEGDPQIIVPWSYSAASGGITDTSEVTLIAAAGAGRSNYLTSMQICNTSATATEVLIKSGGRVLWRCKVGASMTRAVDIEFQRPLISANNTSLSVVCLTTGTETYIDAQGYQDETIEQIQADITAAVELFDAAGDAIYDQSGVVITLPGSIQDSPLTSTNVTDLLAYDLLGAEADGVALDFTDLSVTVRDTATPANNFAGNVNDWLTYTSPSTKWILGSNGLYSSGTTLRTEYNASGTALGVRIEEARTNYWLRSQAFDNASWIKTNVTVTASASVDPAGGTGAFKLVPNTTLGYHAVRQSAAVTAAAHYTVSVFAKAAELSRLIIYEDTATGWYSVFDLSAGTVLNNVLGAVGSIQAVGNGWYRCSVRSGVVSGGSHSLWIEAAANGATTKATWSGDDASGLLIYQADAESGAFATSPIVTAGSTVTRAADIITANVATFPLSQTQSTAFAEAYHNGTSGTRNAIEITATVRADTVFQLYYSGATSMTFAAYAAAFATQANISINISATPAFHKMAARAATNDFQHAVDGALGIADMAGTFPANTLTRFYLGSNNGGGQHLNGHMRRAMYLPRLMSNAEMQTVTT